jgi:hypothetical protein
MKTKIATALSLIGVLSAGSAAALVNTQILDSGPTKSGQSAAVPEQVASTTVPVSAAPSSTVSSTLPTTTAPTIVVTTPSTVASLAPTGFLTTYNVGDAGSVTLDVIDGKLTIVSSAPNAGWQVTKSEQEDDENKVEVDFQSATVRVEFEATFVNGQIVPEVSSSPVVDGSVPRTTIAGGTTPSNTIDGDDDDDDDDDDAFDDDEADDGDDHGDDDHSDDAGDDAGEQDDD